MLVKEKNHGGSAALKNLGYVGGSAAKRRNGDNGGVIGST